MALPDKDARYYPLQAAADALGVRRGTLDRWIKDARLGIYQQRFLADWRKRYLTQAQLERLASLHRRQIATARDADHLARLEDVDWALPERIEADEQRHQRIARAVEALWRD